MKRSHIISITLVCAALAAASGIAQARDRGLCSTAAAAGRWIFATDVGHQMLGGPFPPDADITAIGTMNLDRHGNVEGIFDVTVENFAHLPDVAYTGSLTLDADCRGTLEFVTSQGTARTDSVALVSPWEMLGMSQDPANLWTYKVRRLPQRFGD